RPRLKSPGRRSSRRLINCISIDRVHLSVLDHQCRCTSTLEVTRKHSGIDEVNLFIESRNNSTAGLGCMSDDESRHSKRFREFFNLRKALCVRPLRVSTKPQRTILVDAEPAGIVKKPFKSF